MQIKFGKKQLHVNNKLCLSNNNLPPPPTPSATFWKCDLDISPRQMTLIFDAKEKALSQGIHIGIINYHSKVMANVNVFKDRETDKLKK